LSPARKSLAQFARLLALLALARAPVRGWLSGLDARAKVVGFALVAVTATLLHGIPSLVWCLGLTVAIGVSAGISIRRLSLFACGPVLFTLLLALPATLNVITPGRPLWILAEIRPGGWGPWSWPAQLSVTDHGVYVALRLVLRVAACLAAAFVLLSTTRPDRLWSGLRGLGVPRLAAALLAMMHRYLDVVARAAVEMHWARISRTLGRVNLREEQAWVAAGMGSLYRRTRALAAQVDRAMWSRGFTGEVRLMNRTAWRAAESAFVAGVAVACILLMRLP
jgi:cobalt ECF transporter T component CbiQ